MFYETWESEAHLEKHKNSDHYKACFNAIEGMIEERASNKLTCIA
jgi:quinol monooxygenase YgiN